jgi:nucleoside-diphosphate-sugar epimerase
MICTDVNSVAKSPIACVTGATGMIGRRIVSRLLTLGYQVRVLTRRNYDNQQVSVCKASLSNEVALDSFISSADVVFHCAAELQDESKMWQVNVTATEKITELVRKYNIKYYCFLSSAGVVGRTSVELVDESTPCHPQNRYEETKLEAEKLVVQRIEGCNTVILRPTNVVDSEHLGDLSLPIDGSIVSRLKAFVKGGECAHIVHADDVADAAMFFLDRASSPTPRTFLVSIDDDPLNTVSNLWSLYRKIACDRKCSSLPLPLYFPIIVPYVIRFLLGKPGNSGLVKYSSKLLTSAGFVYSFGVKKTVEDIFLTRSVKNK